MSDVKFWKSRKWKALPCCSFLQLKLYDWEDLLVKLYPPVGRESQPIYHLQEAFPPFPHPWEGKWVKCAKSVEFEAEFYMQQRQKQIPFSISHLFQFRVNFRNEIVPTTFSLFIQTWDQKQAESGMALFMFNFLDLIYLLLRLNFLPNFQSLQLHRFVDLNKSSCCFPYFYEIDSKLGNQRCSNVTV